MYTQGYKKKEEEFRPYKKKVSKNEENTVGVILYHENFFPMSGTFQLPTLHWQADSSCIV